MRVKNLLQSSFELFKQLVQPQSVSQSDSEEARPEAIKMQQLRCMSCDIDLDDQRQTLL